MSPATPLEAKFSLEFGVAAGLISGRVGLHEVSDKFVARNDVQSLIKKVKLRVGPDDDPAYPVGAEYDKVIVNLSDGRIVESKPVRRFRGHGLNPMPEAELRNKFDECVTPKLGEQTTEALYDLLQNLEQLKSVTAIPDLQLWGN